MLNINLKAISILLLSFISYVSCAQVITVQGNIIDSKLHQPVPFASLGIKGKNIGSVADENGIFHFTVDASLLNANEQLLVTSIGYYQAIIALAKFKNGSQTINLTPLNTPLKEVTIKPEKYKTKVFGRTSSSTMMTANMFTQKDLINDNLGNEQATILSIDKHCYIKDFNMLVIFNDFERVKFRLNFYSVKDGQPGELIVNKDILFDVTQSKGWRKVDLSKYNINLEGYDKIAVAIQWVKSVKIDNVARSSFGVSVAPNPLHSMFFRNKSQADWRKVSTSYVAFNLTADSFKGDDKEGESVNEKEELSDSLKNYLAYSKYLEEAVASGYGSNSQTGKYLQLQDAKIYYETYGSGEPLLLLHGNGQSIAAFYKQIPVFAKSYRVITVDTRAQGKSTDSSTGPLTYNLFAEDMKALLDSLHIKQTNIVGWSDGGNTGLTMAIKYPAYVKDLVTMGANLNPSGVDTIVLNDIKKSINRHTGRTDQQSVEQLKLLSILINEPNIVNSDLKGIGSPVLVIAGEKDVIKREHTQEIASNIKNSDVAIIKNATHYAPQEKPEEFNKVVLSFLNKYR